MELVDETGSSLYARLGTLLLEAPSVSPRDLVTRELTDVTLRITDPYEVHVLGTARKPNLKIAATEAMHLLAGLSSLTQLDLASGGRFSQFANDGRLLGAYGPRAHRQLLSVAELLARDPASRQAVVSLWTGDELAGPSRDVPCTTTLQFLLREDRLRLRVSMRSNDYWLGLPYDLMMFSCAHRAMADALNVEAGEYVHTVGSMHLYMRDVAGAYEIANGYTNYNVPAAVAYGIPLPVTTLAPFTKFVDAARAICLNELIDPRLVPNATWLRAHVPTLPVDHALCLTCRYVTAGDWCPSCGDELYEPTEETL